MSETNAKAFFDYLDNSMASSAAKTSAYTYALDSLEKVGWLTTASLVAVAARASTVSFPTGAVRLLHLFYEDRQLFRETRPALREVGGDLWHEAVGFPIAYIEEGEADRLFVPYPRLGQGGPTRAQTSGSIVAASSLYHRTETDFPRNRRLPDGRRWIGCRTGAGMAEPSCSNRRPCAGKATAARCDSHLATRGR